MRVIRLFLVLFICTVPTLARADTVYQVTGSVTVTGNPVCNGLPCIETVNFSFLASYTPMPGVDDLFTEHLISTLSLRSTGPLAPFNSLSATADDYFAFFNSAGDEIDIYGPGFDAEPPNHSFPIFGDAELYGCGIMPADPICVADFGFPIGPTIGHLRDATFQYSAAPARTPEASTLLLLGAGLVGLLLVKTATK